MLEDKIIAKLIEHEEKLADLPTREELHKFRNETLNGQDKMITILKRLDEERIFTNKWIEDIEDNVETNQKDLQKIKLQLNIA